MKRRLLTGHDEDVARFVADLAPIERPKFEPPFWGFGVLKEDGSLVAGIVFSDWKPSFSTIEVSAAAVSSYGISTQIVTTMYGFVFGQLDVFRIFARTSSRNAKAQKMLRHVGYTPEAVQGHYYGPNHHAACWRLLRPEYERKWGSVMEQKAA